MSLLFKLKQAGTRRFSALSQLDSFTKLSQYRERHISRSNSIFIISRRPRAEHIPNTLIPKQRGPFLSRAVSTSQSKMASQKTVAPYGTWTSPISPELVCGGSTAFKELHANPKTGQIYLVEGRPSESGRCALVEIKGSETIDVVSNEFNIRTKVYENGGGAVAIATDGNLIFNDGKTDGVYTLSTSGAVTEILKGENNIRFADFDVHPTETHLILAVKEDHSIGEGRPEQVVNTIALINARTQSSREIVIGADFYSQPKFSHDGKWISWLQWDHPDMPWTGTHLYVASWKDEKICNERQIAGEAKSNSVCQPKWHFNGSLLFGDDTTGFWQLGRYDPVAESIEYILLEGFDRADIGLSENTLGLSVIAPMNNDEVVVVYTKNAVNGLLLYNFATEALTELGVGLIDFAYGRGIIRRVSDTQLAVVAGTANAPMGLYLIDTTKPNEKVLLKSTANIEIDPSLVSELQSVSFPRTASEDQSGEAHAMLFLPHNPAFEAPAGSKPPLIVFIHGGPTLNLGPGLSLPALYFTTRGFAYAFVNHTGSTGYGREYREELQASWGVKDCEDTISFIDHLSGKGLIDRTKVGITGRSAGGYQVLQAMATFPQAFAAGCSVCGIGNLRSLAVETHKFESHYLFGLIFREGATEKDKEEILTNRSPALNAAKIERPLLLLQGEADRVVPPGQAIEMEKILKEDGKDVKLVLFEGEGHSFVKEENLRTSLKEEEALWKRTLL